MMPQDLFVASVVAAIVALVLRLIAVAGYGRGHSRLLVFYLPTLALLGLALITFLVWELNVLPPGGWGSVLAWVAVALSQLIAAVHAWLPPRPDTNPRAVPVHDAQMFAKLDEMEDRYEERQDTTDAKLDSMEQSVDVMIEEQREP